MSEEKIKLKPTSTFYEELNELPEKIQKKTWKKLELFQSSPRHPSLRVKKMKGYEKIWELSITQAYRVTFQWGQCQSRTAVLRRIGTHDMLRNP